MAGTHSAWRSVAALTDTHTGKAINDFTIEPCAAELFVGIFHPFKAGICVGNTSF